MKQQGQGEEKGQLGVCGLYMKTLSSSEKANGDTEESTEYCYECAHALWSVQLLAAFFNDKCVTE